MSHASVAKLLRAAECEIFIAKMKRESTAVATRASVPFYGLRRVLRFVCSHPDQTTEMNYILRRRATSSHRLPPFILAAAALAAPVAGLRLGAAQAGASLPSASPVGTERPLLLEPVVVSATRTPQDPGYASSAITLLSLEELQRIQITDLSGAIAREPGVNVVNSGATGAESSVFIRGANSDHTLFVVDGVPMNSRGARYTSFLGGADLAGIDRVELLRGSQSTLYGSSAIGGVILVDTARGCGPAQSALSAMSGSYGTYGGSATLSGGTQRLGVSASLSHEHADNNRPDNAYNATNGAARLDLVVTPVFTVGGTFRDQKRNYQEPGSITFPLPGDVGSENRLGTVYSEWRPDADFRSRLTVGLHQRDYTFYSSSFTDSVMGERRLLEWQNVWETNDWLELVGGLSASREHGAWSGTNYTENQSAGYFLATARPVQNVSLTVGLRSDHFESYGDETTGRLGLARRLSSSDTKLRASCGNGFQAPGADDRYGVPAYFQPASPGIAPERSRSWDAGVDQGFLGDRITASATYFQTHFDNLFSYDLDTFATINIPDAFANGVELSLAGRLSDTVTLHVGYTRLEAENEANKLRLIRRPRHTVTLDGDWRADSAWTFGGGVRAVIDRVDGNPYAPARLEDYTTVRLFAAWQVCKDLVLRFRLENALDEKYQETQGYPALPRAAYLSAEWRR